MYICVCRAVTDKQLHHAINNGACTRQQLTHCLGVGRDCGKCNREIKQFLKQYDVPKTTYSHHTLTVINN